MRVKRESIPNRDSILINLQFALSNSRKYFSKLNRNERTDDCILQVPNDIYLFDEG